MDAGWYLIMPLATEKTKGVNRLPREARDGLMRAWLEILKERHPAVTWIAKEATPAEASDNNRSEALNRVAA
jgi:hypothetical protein